MYRIVLTLDAGEIDIPVLPERLKVKSNGKNEKAEVIELGEVTLIRKKALKEVAWSSFFPANDVPFANTTTGVNVVPVLTTLPVTSVTETGVMQTVTMIQKQRDSQKPIWLTLVGTDLDINIQMAIQNFEYEERYGETGDLYYTISLREWTDYSPKRITISEKDGKVTAQVSEPKRSGAPAIASKKSYTVQAGDTLWSVAKMFYDNGDDYIALYERNKKNIDNNNKDKSAFMFDIEEGQELFLQ